MRLLVRHEDDERTDSFGVFFGEDLTPSGHAFVEQRSIEYHCGEGFFGLQIGRVAKVGQRAPGNGANTVA